MTLLPNEHSDCVAFCRGAPPGEVTPVRHAMEALDIFGISAALQYTAVKDDVSSFA